MIHYAVGNSSISEYPDIVSSHLEHTIESACWYWRHGSAWGDINPMAERSDFLSVTMAVNGGYRHVVERNLLLIKLAALLKLDQCRNATQIKLRNFKFEGSSMHDSSWYSGHLQKAAHVENALSAIY